MLCRVGVHACASLLLRDEYHPQTNHNRLITCCMRACMRTPIDGRYAGWAALQKSANRQQPGFVQPGTLPSLSLRASLWAGCVLPRRPPPLTPHQPLSETVERTQCNPQRSIIQQSHFAAFQVVRCCGTQRSGLLQASCTAVDHSFCRNQHAVCTNKIPAPKTLLPPPRPPFHSLARGSV